MEMFWTILPWCLSAGTMATVYLLGKRHRFGFLLSTAAQIPWLAFDFHVGAYGLMPLALVLGGLNIKGWLEWGKIAPHK